MDSKTTTQTVDEGTVPAPVGSREQAFKKLLADVKEKMEAWNRDDILGRHKIGRLILKVRDEVTYGKKAVARIAEETGYEKTWLYNTADVAEVWPEGELEEILARCDRERGRQVSWSHLVAVAGLSDVEKRRHLIDAVIEHGLSVRELRERIDTPPDEKSRTETAPNADRGSPQTKRAVRSVRDMINYAGTVKGNEEIWSTAISKIRDSDTEIDPQIVEDLKKALLTITQAQEGLDRLSKELCEVLQNRAVAA